MTEDEQTALSWKYRAVRVVPLPSGRFAIFGQFSNSDGLPLRGIVEASMLVETICLEMNDNLRPEPPPKTKTVIRVPAPLPTRTADDILGDI